MNKLVPENLEELTLLYDNTYEHGQDAYKDEIEQATNALKEKAPEEYDTLMYWNGIRNAYDIVTEEALTELEKEIKLLVIQLGKSYKTRLFTWVFNKGRESWKNDIVRGFLIAHKADVAEFMEKGNPSITCRKNKT